MHFPRAGIGIAFDSSLNQTKRARRRCQM